MSETQPLLRPSDGQHRDGSTDRKQPYVKFDPNGDPDDPYQWDRKYRYGIVLLLFMMAFTVTFTCMGIVPVAGLVVEDLEGRENKSASVLFVTIWELGEAAGPLFIAPLSETYGRWPVVNIANGLFVIGVLLQAISPSANLLIFARFLTGCAVQTNVLNPAIIADMFPSESRGSVMSAVFLAPLAGAAIGPALAGAIAQATGWREILWIAVGLAAACEFAFLTLFRETYKVTILRKRAARLRQETGENSFQTEYDDEDEASPLRILARTMLRPIKTFSSSFILQILSLWGALVFAFFYVMSVTLPDMLQDVYDFDTAQTGVSFLSYCAGSVLAVIVCNLLVDSVYVTIQDQHKGEFYPEGRLPFVVFGAFLLPLAIVFYGWSAALHWPVWSFLTVVVILGFAIILSIVPMTTYVTDAFGSTHAASALTAVLITRCLAGTFLPLTTASLTNTLGYGYGFMIVAAPILLLAPIPGLVMLYGPRWREKCAYTESDSSDNLSP